jgi:hypothetical protein
MTFNSLHSPLTLGFVDSLGNYTGMIGTTTISTVPDVQYERFGEVQWLSVPKGLAGYVVMHGTASGSFTLDVENQNGNTVTATTTFAGITSSTSTTAVLAIDPAISPTASSTLQIDYNGDGTVESTYHAKQGGVVVADITPPEIQLSFSTSTNALQITATDDITKNPTVTSTTTYPVLKKQKDRDKDNDDKRSNGVATTTVTARDEAGNTTTFIYAYQFPIKDRRIGITPISITYNGATTTLSNTQLKYKWTLNTNSTSTPYKMLASYIQISSTSTESHWRPKKNQTILMTRPVDFNDDDGDGEADVRPTKTILSGLVIPYITTNQGRIIISY